MRMVYFSFLTGYLSVLSLGRVLSETVTMSTSLSKLLEISRYSKPYKEDISMGNYLSLFPYRLSDFKYFSLDK